MDADTVNIAIVLISLALAAGAMYLAYAGDYILGVCFIIGACLLITSPY